MDSRLSCCSLIPLNWKEKTNQPKQRCLCAGAATRNLETSLDSSESRKQLGRRAIRANSTCGHISPVVTFVAVYLFGTRKMACSFGVGVAIHFCGRRRNRADGCKRRCVEV